jgi:hypothetical protein
MSAAFVVRSEPGVGKSAVLADLVANAAVCEAQHDVATSRPRRRGGEPL